MRWPVMLSGDGSIIRLFVPRHVAGHTTAANLLRVSGRRRPVEGNGRFAASDTAFDRWFKELLATLFPPAIDFNQPLPPVREIFDSEALANHV